MPREIRQLLNEKPFLLMGILNLTPDSFYDGGRHRSVESALRHVYKMKEEGADIIDIGAESTRPGSLPLSAEDEWNRLKPLLSELSKDKFDLPVSIDTQKSEVAVKALDLGASIINDISAGRNDSLMFKTARERNADIILMHMKGSPGNMQNMPFYEDVLREVGSELRSFAQTALENGIQKDKIILDPGMGFGKRKEDNLALISGIGFLTELGFPVLVGVSRKSVIGDITGAQADHRLPGTIALNVLALLGGARIFRVHDVKENRQALECALEAVKIKPAH
jgi:dihydropteroate synthase